MLRLKQVAHTRLQPSSATPPPQPDANAKDANGARTESSDVKAQQDGSERKRFAGGGAVGVQIVQYSSDDVPPPPKTSRPEAPTLRAVVRAAQSVSMTTSNTTIQPNTTTTTPPNHTYMVTPTTDQPPIDHSPATITVANSPPTASHLGVRPISDVIEVSLLVRFIDMSIFCSPMNSHHRTMASPY